MTIPPATTMTAAEYRAYLAAGGTSTTEAERARVRQRSAHDLADTLAEQCRMAGLPVPEREARLVEGRKWRYDCVWRSQRLVVEVDGGIALLGRHQRAAGYAADCEKQAAAVLAGWRVVRVPGEWVRDGSALGWVERALGASLTPPT